MLEPSSEGFLNVGIIRSSSIGDIILATSCLDLLKQLSYPVKVTWIGRNPGLALIKSAFPDIEILEMSSYDSTAEVVKQLSKIHLLVDLQTNLKTHLICRQFRKIYGKTSFTCNKLQLHRSRLVLEGRIYGRRRILPPRAIKPSKLQYKLMSDTLYYALMDLLPEKYTNSIKQFKPQPFLPIEHFDQSTAKVKFQSHKEDLWLAIAPGASFEVKAAPVHIFMAIINKLEEIKAQKKELSTVGLIFVGDENDRKVSHDIINRMSWSGPVMNICGEVSLFETAAILKQTKCLLGNDSALGHMAEAVQTPVAILFGPTVEGFGFAPRLKTSRAFSTPLGCRPCSKHGKTPCRYKDKKCFEELSTHDIASFLVQRLLMSSN